MNIKLVDVWYKYPPSKIALRRVSLEITEKKTIIVGPNASGKTTLLKILSLMYKPWKGAILVGSKSYWELDEKEQLAIRRRLIYVHEKPVFIRGTVLDNILLGFKIRKINLNKHEIIDKALHLLEIFGLEKTANIKPRNLSTGQLQLISIIRALVLEPDVLLLDEPTANLDIEKRKILLRYLEEYVKKNSGRKIVIATHDLLIPLLLEDSYVVVLSDGRIASRGYVDEILGYEYEKLFNVLKKKGT